MLRLFDKLLFVTITVIIRSTSRVSRTHAITNTHRADQEGFSWLCGTQLSSLQYTVLEFLQRQPGLLTRS